MYSGPSLYLNSPVPEGVQISENFKFVNNFNDVAKINDCNFVMYI